MLPGVAAARHDAPLTAAPMPYHWPMLGIDVQGSAGASGGPFCGALQLVANATSLGGPETLVEHRASVEAPMPSVRPACCECRSAWNTPTT